MIHSCKTHGRKWCVRCVGITLGFPIEHLLWERVPVFSTLAHLLGL
jgi:hypothetical protein